MSGILKNFKQTFSAPKQVLDETSKAILDIESKKRTIAQASNNEQNVIKTKIIDEYRKIGETSYTLYESGNFAVEKIAGMFQTIKGLYQTLDEKQAKLNEILGRYDEELKILRPAPVSQSGQAVCQNCNSAYIPGEMLFCSGCGNKLDAVEVPPAPAANACPNCNMVNVADAVFCSGCGNKL